MSSQADQAASVGAFSAKDAVRAASAYFMELTGILTGVSVEEVELSEDGCFWLITLGYYDPANPFSGLVVRGVLSYKVFKIDAKTGQVVSMKVRKV